MLTILKKIVYEKNDEIKESIIFHCLDSIRIDLVRTDEQKKNHHDMAKIYGWKRKSRTHTHHHHKQPDHLNNKILNSDFCSLFVCNCMYNHTETNERRPIEKKT